MEHSKLPTLGKLWKELRVLFFVTDYRRLSTDY
jgi:hypothetical protein